MPDTPYRGIRYVAQVALFGRTYARVLARFRGEHDAVRADRARRGVVLPEDGWVCHNATWTVPASQPPREATDA